MTDKSNERLYNVFTRVTKLSKDTYIDINTAVTVMNAVERGLNCTEKGLVSALNEYNHSILDTLLGRHRLIGIDILPEYQQYMTELDKMYRKVNPGLVYTFLNKDDTIKSIIETHIAKAKSPKSCITKDQMTKLLFGYGRRYQEKLRRIQQICNDPDTFLYQMHAFFGVDLVEENTNYKWYIRGYIPKFEYINNRPIELDWKKDAITVDTLTQVLKEAAAEQPATMTLDESIKTLSQYEQMYIRPIVGFLEWLETVNTYTENSSNCIPEARIMKAYRYYCTTNNKGATVTRIGTERFLKSITTLKTLAEKHECVIPKITFQFTVDNDNKAIILPMWSMPQDVVGLINGDTSDTKTTVSDTAPTSISSTSSNYVNTKQTSSPEASTITTTSTGTSKVWFNKNLPRKIVALTNQMYNCKDDVRASKSITTGCEEELMDIFRKLASNELAMQCFYLNNEPYINGIARKHFGMTRVQNTTEYYTITFFFSQDPKLLGTNSGLKLVVDKHKVMAYYPENAYPYGFSVSDFVDDLVQFIKHYV